MKNTSLVFLFKCFVIGLLIAIIHMVAASAMNDDGFDKRKFKKQESLRIGVLKRELRKKIMREHKTLLRAVQNGDVDTVQCVLQRNPERAVKLIITLDDQWYSAFDYLEALLKIEGKSPRYLAIKNLFSQYSLKK